MLFIALGLLELGNEVFDIPHYLFGFSVTPVNWPELFLEIALAGCIGIYVMYMLNFNITKRMIIEKEREALIEQLQDANKRLEKLDKVKTQFVANVSHEFINPLTAMRMSLEYFMMDSTDHITKDEKHTIELGKKSIDRLLRLVEDLLDVSKIESGKAVLRKETIDVKELLDDILSLYKNTMAQKELILNVDMQDDIGKVCADRDKLTEIIINIFTNAIKYTPCDGTIKIKASGSKDELKFEISDTGPGIPKEYYDKIFDKYERIIKDNQEGTGLGLPIAKDLVELHSGKLWVSSEMGKGTTFTFTLPRALKA